MNVKPKTVCHRSVYQLTEFCSRMTAMAPITEPNNVPIPPTIAISSAETD